MGLFISELHFYARSWTAATSDETKMPAHYGYDGGAD